MPPKTNPLGLTRQDYMGEKSTLCTGCGHDSITAHIISALYKAGVNPFNIVKVSGIGCSSKTPTYFLSQSHGFNSIHGRMASLATGAKSVNYGLKFIGISGDGDTASIGLGGFAHLIRRNVPMVYIVENNGVYGLTKGQFSATADKNSTLKDGTPNPFPGIDLCSLALDLGCGFVARSFSGDSKQLVPLIEAALQHPGTAFIDVISPCVTFGNHEGSTKSYNYIKEHRVSLQELDFIAPFQSIHVDYEEGSSETVQLPDGSFLILKKIDSKSHDVHNPLEAYKKIKQSNEKGEILTGLFYINEEIPDLAEDIDLDTTIPLVELTEQQLLLPEKNLKEALQEFE